MLFTLHHLPTSKLTSSSINQLANDYPILRKPVWGFGFSISNFLRISTFGFRISAISYLLVRRMPNTTIPMTNPTIRMIMAAVPKMLAFAVTWMETVFGSASSG